MLMKLARCAYRRYSIPLAYALALTALLVARFPQPVAQSAFDVTRFAATFTQPTAMAFARDGRLFVAEKTGALRVAAADGTVRAAPFVSLTVYSGGERGLLGVALDPGFESNRFVYVYYTPVYYQNRVSRFTADPASPDRAIAGSERIILDNIPAHGNHNAGALHFGQDGKLYVAVGDTKNSALAQSLDSLAGKILRLDPTTYPDVVPPDNPFAATIPARPEVWALGLRNPFTFAFDRNGRMFINDVGQYTWEEINAGQAGANYGWPSCEGPANNGVGNCTAPSFSYPIASYRHRSEDGFAITGGVFYEAAQFPVEYRNNYFFGDYVSNWIRRLTPANEIVTFLTGTLTPVDLDVGPDGSLYYLSHSEGAVYRVRYGAGNRNPVASFTASPVSGPAPLTVTFDAGDSDDPDGNQLTYQWNFGDGTTGIGTLVTHTYTNGGVRTATLTVSDGFGGVGVATRTVAIGLPPTGSITTPVVGRQYAAGETIGFEGTGVDPETGVLPLSAFSWTIVFHHDTHTHPFLGPLNGVTSGAFTVPDSGEESPNVWYRIHLTVTDGSGLTHRTYRDVLPRTVNLTLQTQPPGIELTLDGQPVVTPLVVRSVVGLRRVVGAGAFASSSGSSYEYQSWSDGGSRIHDIVTPSSNATYTAVFKPAVAHIPSRQTYLAFDGAGDHIGIPSSSDLGGGSVLTVSAWIRPAVNDTGMYIVTKGRSGREQWMLRRVRSNNKIVFNVRGADDTLRAADSPTAYATDLAWHHVAGVYDGSNLQLFLDGTRVTSTSVSVGGLVEDEPGSVCIGALSAGGDNCGTSSTFHGDIDDVQIWNRALSEEEIRGIMDGALAGTQPGLAGYWPLNEGSGQISGDRASLGVHPARLGALSTIDSDDPEWVGLNDDVVAPSVVLVDPPVGAVVAGTWTLRATATDDTAVAAVQFQLNGQALGAEDTTSPYAIAWSTTSYANGLHMLTALARDADGNVALSAPVAVLVDNGTAPNVQVTAPTTGATVSGVVTVSANAGDNVAVAGVQFLLDAAVLGTEDTSAPYTATWDTQTSANGVHALAAVARDTAGNMTASAATNVSVQNANPPPLIANLRVSSLTSTGGTISWTTSIPADTQIEYGVSTAYGSVTTLIPALTTGHTQSLISLQPSTVYHVRARSRDSLGRLAVSEDVTLITQATTPSGLRTRYLSFNGAGDRVSVPYSADVAEGTALTVSAWIRPAVNDVSMYIVTKATSGTPQWLLRRVRSNNAVVFNVANASGTMVAADSPVGFGTDLGWHHIAGVYDGNRVYLYIDGSRSASTSAPLSGPIRDAAHSICLGAVDPGSGHCGGSSTFHGDIDDVRIYNRALSHQEIQQAMVTEAAGSEFGLAAYWQFNEGESQVATDSTPAGLAGVLGTTLGIESADPEWVGLANQAVRHDAVAPFGAVLQTPQVEPATRRLSMTVSELSLLVRTRDDVSGSIARARRWYSRSTLNGGSSPGPVAPWRYTWRGP